MGGGLGGGEEDDVGENERGSCRIYIPLDAFAKKSS
jgi:hypothetical protein